MSIGVETVTTEFAEASGARYAYLRFGGPSDMPLVSCHRGRRLGTTMGSHFRESALAHGRNLPFSLSTMRETWQTVRVHTPT